jgi:hypothetical protein
MYYWMCGIVNDKSILIFEIQALLCMACLTFHFLRVEASKIRGAISVGLLPLSHGESQNGAMLPLPMVILEAALQHLLKYYNVQKK